MNYSNQYLAEPRAGTSSAAGSAGDAEINIGALLGVLWRGKWLIVACIGVVVLIAGVYVFALAVPSYKADAVVMLDTRAEQVVDLQSVLGGLSGNSSEVTSEAEVLKSRGLMGKVVDKLNLTEDPEFNATLQPPSGLTLLKARIKGLIGADTPKGVLPPDVAAARTRDNTITALLGHVAVRNIPLSLVFDVTVETQDPVKSAQIADTIVNLYILNQLDVKFQATEQATSWLTKRVADLQAELEQAEQKVKEFSTSTDLVDQDTLAALERQLKDLRDRVTEAKTQQTASAARLEAIDAARTRTDQAQATGDSILLGLLPKVAVEDPAAVQAFDQRFQMLLKRAQVDVDRTGSQIAALEKSASELETQISRQGQDLITLQQLTREADASKLLYEYFLSRLKETSAQQGIQQADSHLLSKAVVPAYPSAPRKSLIGAMSVVLGLMLGAAMVLIREARQNTFRTARDLEYGTGYTVMGQVPSLPARRRKDAVSYLASRPTSAAAEAIRNLRTSVLLSNIDRPPQVIVATSSIPGEGKTTLSLALAQNFTGLGKKVLLIEGDIRRRVFSQYLEVDRKEGLLAVLSGSNDLNDVVIHDPSIGCDVLIGEASSTNAADVFSSERFKRFLEEARNSYDQIIIDTPPVLVVPDARVIAQIADAILFVVKWDKTSKGQVEEALRMFESVGQRVSGLVLNNISQRGMKRYGYGGKYGAYSAYGRKYYNN